MGISTEVKRTLVKSRPELWNELNDPQSLARHLDGIGEITITRTEPEAAVDWEADGATGSVRLEPSGFGTKVTLSLSRELQETASIPEPEQAVEPEAHAAPLAAQPPSDAPEPVAAAVVAEPEPAAAEAAPEPIATPAPDPEPIATPAAGPEPVAIAAPGPEPVATPAPDPEPVAEHEPKQEPAAGPRRGFFARLFKRRPKEALSPAAGAPEALVVEPEPTTVAEPVAGSEPIDQPEADSQAVEPQPCAVVESQPCAVVESQPETEPVRPVEPEPQERGPQEPEPQEREPQQTVSEPETASSLPRPDPAADLAALEADMAAQDEEMLTAMLDRLGAAHHRPFSRS